MTNIAPSLEQAELTEQPVGRRGDLVFSGLSKAAGITILVALAAVAVFLVLEAWPSITASASDMEDGIGLIEYVGPYVFGTIVAATLALVVATPLAICVALFITHYAPRKLALALGYFVDLLAAVPSVVIGIWGIATLAPILAGDVYPWLADNLSFIPFFAGPAASSGRTMLTAGLVLGLMILPIITAVSREVFLQTPRLHEEASLALGATRWEMIRQAVLPYGRSGVISGAMLGLGRALGETMAVAIILAPGRLYSLNLISTQNPNTIAANVALQFPEADGLEVNRLIATGLVLFIITFAVNAVARRVAQSGFAGNAG